MEIIYQAFNCSSFEVVSSSFEANVLPQNILFQNNLVLRGTLRLILNTELFQSVQETGLDLEKRVNGIWH